MTEYHKIKTVWTRDPENRFRTLIEDQWATDEFALLKDCPWIWTEKIDGTNIRIMYEDGLVRFGGRTDNAQIPTFLLDRLMVLFNPQTLRGPFPDGNAILYGEGYGAKIQKGGGNYIPDGVDFILFDVRVGDVWLTRDSVMDVADKMKIKVVPGMGIGSLSEMVEAVRSGLRSAVAEREAEGIVARPLVDLFDRRGQRIITKIKVKDFVLG